MAKMANSLIRPQESTGAEIAFAQMEADTHIIANVEIDFGNNSVGSTCLGTIRSNRMDNPGVSKDAERPMYPAGGLFRIPLGTMLTRLMDCSSVQQEFQADSTVVVPSYDCRMRDFFSSSDRVE